MIDQADKLRQLVRETVREHTVLQPGVPLVTVCGARIGVGTTTIALSLAHELAQLGKRVVLVDANLRSPRLTNSRNSPPTDGLAEVLNGQRSVAEVLEQISDGIQLLPGVDVSSESLEMNPRAVGRLLADLRSLKNCADLIVIDVGVGMNPWIERFWTAALQILLVSTPQSAAIMDGYAAVKLAPWGDVDGKLRLVVNQSNSPGEGMRVSDSFTSTCRRFLGMKLLGDAAVLALDKQLPLGATSLSIMSPFRRSLRLLAADLLSQTHLVQVRNSPATYNHSTEDSQGAALVMEVAQGFAA